MTDPDPGARIDTPALVLDLDAFEANLGTMAALARGRGVALRPHAKSHKSARIGGRQLEAGAVGLCCAKLGEAEALAAEGLDGLLITSAVQDPAKVRRLAALARRLGDLAVVVEDAANARDLADAASSAGVRLRVLIDVDIGTHRFGVPTIDGVVALAEVIAGLPALEPRGLQGYVGHVQAVPDYAERRALSLEALGFLGRARDALLAAGLPCPVVSGGGTGTHDFDHEAGVLTELQVGSYVFSDVIYDGVAMAPDAPHRFANALFVHTRVVSAQHPGFATTDAGHKSFATDGPAPVIASGAPPGSTYARFGDEFGRVVLPDPRGRLPVGTLLRCVVPHCDPTVNLFDRYHCVRDGRLVDVWPIEARGRSD